MPFYPDVKHLAHCAWSRVKFLHVYSHPCRKCPGSHLTAKSLGQGLGKFVFLGSLWWGDHLCHLLLELTLSLCNLSLGLTFCLALCSSRLFILQKQVLQCTRVTGSHLAVAQPSTEKSPHSLENCNYWYPQGSRLLEQGSS